MPVVARSPTGWAAQGARGRRSPRRTVSNAGSFLGQTIMMSHGGESATYTHWETPCNHAWLLLGEVLQLFLVGPANPWYFEISLDIRNTQRSLPYRNDSTRSQLTMRHHPCSEAGDEGAMLRSGQSGLAPNRDMDIRLNDSGLLF